MRQPDKDMVFNVVQIFLRNQDIGEAGCMVVTLLSSKEEAMLLKRERLERERENRKEGVGGAEKQMNKSDWLTLPFPC